MKSLSPILLLIALHASAGATTYVNFVRQIQQQGSGTVWDMPVAPVGAAPSALNLQTGGALFQLWTVEQPSAQNYLLDQKLVATYLPSASVTVTTLDSYKRAPRTRVDKPFTVQINVTGIVTTATNGSKEQTRVMLQRYLGNYPSGNLPLDPVAVTAGNPPGPSPARGCGNAVERAVWNRILPSTFCTIWWIWPFSTVTDPKRRSSVAICSPSAVPQPQGS